MAESRMGRKIVSLALYEFGLKLKAADTRKALLVKTHKTTRISKEALIISVVAMSGEHAGTWAVAIGSQNTRKPKVLSCPDPSNFYDLVQMWDDMERHISSHFYMANEKEQPAQIVVANRKTWDVLAETAKRLAHTNSLRIFRLAQMILHANDRVHLAGDPTVICISELLNTTFVTGEEPDETMNLKKTLVWIKGELPDSSSLDEVEDSERDDECFLPRDQEDSEFYESYSASRQTTEETKRKNVSVKHRTKLQTIAKQRWLTLKEATEIYQNLKLPAVAELEIFEQMARQDLKKFLADLEVDELLYAQEIADKQKEKEAVQDIIETKTTIFTADLISEQQEIPAGNKDGPPRKFRKLRKYDSRLSAVQKLAKRIAYANEWEKVLVWNDYHERKKMFADGRIVEGTVTEETKEGYWINVPHDMMRVREGEELYSFSNHKNTVQIVKMQREKNNTKVLVVSNHNMRQEENVSFGVSPPDPKRIERNIFSQLAAHKRVGWTHKTKMEPPSISKKLPPKNILDKVNSARAE